MIERFHRSLKASLMCISNLQWTKSLPTVLLGLRTVLREDFKTSSAELVYGQPLRLPHDFFVPSANDQLQSGFAQNLRRHFDLIRPVPAARHNKERIFVFKELYTCSHVFVRTDAVRKALQQPYEGPNQVIKRNDKYFTIIIRGKENTVSIDRLKPCFTEASDVPTNSNKDENVSAGPDEELTDNNSIPYSDKIVKNHTTKHVTLNLKNEIKSQPVKTRTGRSITIPSRFR